jgi:hypothetical protein
MSLQTRYHLAFAELDHGARIAAEVDGAAWGSGERFLTPFLCASWRRPANDMHLTRL